MKRITTLGGYGAFRRVMSSGVRVDGRVLKCFFKISESGAGRLAAGVTVRDRSLNAVRRNYLKRIMRETLRASAGPLLRRLSETENGAELVVAYRPPMQQQSPSRRKKFAEVRHDMLKILHKIESQL